MGNQPPRKSRSKKPAKPHFYGRSELIVVLKSREDFDDSQGRLFSNARTKTLIHILREAKAEILPLFGDANVADSESTPVPLKDEMDRYFCVLAQDDSNFERLAKKLDLHPLVEAAYVKPPAEPATLRDVGSPDGSVTPVANGNYVARQGYLNAAPEGVDARYGWRFGGGKGKRIKIIDVEGDWRFSHRDLRERQGGLVAGRRVGDQGWRNHGTAVLGVFGADDNNTGVVGICPDAYARTASVFDRGSAYAIKKAANSLGSGDIILIEQHRPGPRYNFESRWDQKGYIAVEWWPDDFVAIAYAASRGVLVVEAAGNGEEDLDDAIYDHRPANFPSSWQNPFRRRQDSKAIIVGAGAPPPGTHGENHGPDRARLDFSNYGECVDAQGWGREVTTCGYGDLQGGSNEDLWYTDTFSGTSSASPIIVGALAVLQGILKASGHSLLTPTEARNLLRLTGSPQQDAPGRPASQRIGNRPDLRQALIRLGFTKPESARARLATSITGCDGTICPADALQAIT
jgi:hypothetical protein